MRSAALPRVHSVAPGGNEQGNAPLRYWSLAPSEVCALLGSGTDGLSSEEAARRLALLGPNELRSNGRLSRARVLWNQLRSPLLMLLLFAAAVSAASGEWVDSAIVLAILGASVLVGYFRSALLLPQPLFS